MAPFPYAGEVFALLAPMCWSVAIVLYRRSTATASPAQINLFKNALAVVLLGLTMVVLGVGLPADRSAADWIALAVSGALGLAVADTLVFVALQRLGAARLAIVDTAYAPTVVLLAWAWLHESLPAAFLAGASLVLGGVVLATLRPEVRIGDPSPAALTTGTAIGLAAIVCNAVGVLIAKPILERSDLVEVTFTRLVAGVVLQAAWLAVRGELRGTLAVFRPAPVWSTLLPAAVIGTYISMVLWLGGFKWADASVAAVLNQMATVYIVVLAWVFLGEGLTRRQVFGGVIAAVGAGVILASA